MERLKQNAPLNELNRDTLYGGGAKGLHRLPGNWQADRCAPRARQGPLSPIEGLFTRITMRVKSRSYAGSRAAMGQRVHVGGKRGIHGSPVIVIQVSLPQATMVSSRRMCSR